MNNDRPFFPFADAPSIVQAHQKDSYAVSLLGKKLEDALKSMAGQLFANRYSGNISIGSKLLYLIVTTLRNKRTLGEEYVDLIYVDRNGTRLVRKWRRLLFILSYTVLPYFLAKVFNRVKKSFIKESEYDDNENKNEVLDYLRDLTFKDVINNILNLHILTFYISGKFYQLSKRVFGLRYAISHDVSEEESKLRMSNSRTYRILGGIVFLQFLVKIAPLVGKLKTRYIKRSTNDGSDKTGVVSGIPTEGTYQKLDLNDAGTLSFIPEQSRKCILCLVDMVEPSCLPCGHMFCWHCIIQWCSSRQECPLCRQHCSKQSVLPIRQY
ncbi:HCL286Wp [Eremothecium sinecaudum]|uniref:RING-type E3 ubiquitin transferase n=1 Tax=Eremothecium sinecaudum TaxID=45286 RepID=A0A109UYI8_9SACH|nr:HCL286Wp [Eremothecium sinecaudum]AMD19865.1 HCL286Wp [Eremothecium sinecaudum]